MSKSTSKTNGKKSPAKNGNGHAKKNGNGSSASKRKPNALHETLIKLMTRPNGATMHETWNAGYPFPARAALKIAERRGLKVSVIKRKGELTRYCAK